MKSLLNNKGLFVAAYIIGGTLAIITSGFILGWW